MSTRTTSPRSAQLGRPAANPAPGIIRVLDPEQWVPLAREHAQAVQQRTRHRRERLETGRKHPVEDFLFEYYNHRTSHFARWHPEPGEALAGAEAAERQDWPFYRWDGSTAWVGLPAAARARGNAIVFFGALLRATLRRQAQVGCFGLHEWAMVYRAEEEQIRHGGWPLRLGSRGTDEVVESQRVRCTHVDAFRFFTPAARDHNTVQPTRETQVENEQPGCLHANMDLYKVCFKLSPLIPSRLTLATFDLAYEIRELDMRAAPYDLSELGYEPVRIETPQGRAEYAARQRRFADRANALRREILGVLEQVEPWLGR